MRGAVRTADTVVIALSIPEAATAVDMTPAMLRKAIHAGQLRAKRQSRDEAGNGVGKYLISVKALEEWFEGLEDA